jgi:nucleoside-diphosphate-sugar epimerase
MTRVFVTGGGGYVGAVLVPSLLDAGYEVTVLDLFLYGEEVLDPVRGHQHLTCVRGDMRDRDLVARSLAGCDAVIHLACISNDPSFELDPQLGKSINHDAFRPLVEAAARQGVSRFIYASSSSVYGVKEELHVTEDLPLDPLTDYSRFKARCEEILREYQSPDFCCTTLRPATVCGYSPRLRLDLTVNILTNHAINEGRIRVFGGTQFRPNIHIHDMVDAYLTVLRLPTEQVAGKTWNVGYENFSVREIADKVRATVGAEDVGIITEPTNDLRSYRVDSRRIFEDIRFQARRSIEDAVRDLVAAFGQGLIPDPMNGIRYYNIRTMQAAGLR